jgi:hypothetical protein
MNQLSRLEAREEIRDLDDSYVPKGPTMQKRDVMSCDLTSAAERLLP